MLIFLDLAIAVTVAVLVTLAQDVRLQSFVFARRNREDWAPALKVLRQLPLAPRPLIWRELEVDRVDVFRKSVGDHEHLVRDELLGPLIRLLFQLFFGV